jgi:predicted nuclease with TOPRIM domain
MTESDMKKSQAPKIEELVFKLMKIQSELKQDLVDLRQKMETFEAKPELLNGLESFKKDAESRAYNLEEEVKQLREELTAIKEILGLNSEKISWIHKRDTVILLSVDNQSLEYAL